MIIFYMQALRAACAGSLLGGGAEGGDGADEQIASRCI